MIPPSNCPYKGLTATPCWSCPHYIADIDGCRLNSVARIGVSHTGTDNNAGSAQTYEGRLRDYERRRQELLQLSKDALVDLILHRPEY